MTSKTAADRPAIDQETVYDLLYRERWPELIDLVHWHRDAIADDPLLAHAVDVFARTMVARLENDGRVAGRVDVDRRNEVDGRLDMDGRIETGGQRETDLRIEEGGPAESELEKLFLLHVGGHYRLEAGLFDRVVDRLVLLNEHRPEAALGYARHCPESPRCAEILRRHDVLRRVEHARSDRITLDVTRPTGRADHTISLLKSRREVDFFMAVREVFATYLVYPNVALRSLIDFDAVRDGLSAEERRFFFLGVVDCVVFDQHRDYRPIYFFEVDSPLHDTDDRRANDGMKDRIVSAAGHRLHRIRPHGRAVGREELAAVIRDALGIRS